MLNWIWLAFLLIAVVVGGFTGRLGQVENGAFEAAKDAVMKVALPLMGLWAIWLGMMRLAEQSGLVQLFARALRPLMRRLFPEVPPEHPAMGAMVLNMAANMLGLGNAATPLGLRAMAHLQRLNPYPHIASNAMCTFLALNTASIQLVPTTAISILILHGSKSASDIWPTAFFATVIAATSGVLAAKFFERLPIFRARPDDGQTTPEQAKAAASVEETVAAEQVQAGELKTWGRVALGFYFAFFALLFLMMVFPDLFQRLGIAVPPPPKNLEGKALFARSLFGIATLAIPFLLSFFPLYAALRGVRVYEQFVEGAKEAWGTTQRVIPYLIAMLVSIRMLNEAGVIAQVTRQLSGVMAKLHFPPDLLPLVLMRPLSGSATNGIFIDLVQRIGPDTLTAKTAATIYGSTETTFYVIAVYFGSVAIRQTRHAIAAGLVADTVAVIASVVLCNLLFT